MTDIIWHQAIVSRERRYERNRHHSCFGLYSVYWVFWVKNFSLANVV